MRANATRAPTENSLPHKLMCVCVCVRAGSSPGTWTSTQFRCFIDMLDPVQTGS